MVMTPIHVHRALGLGQLQTKEIQSELHCPPPNPLYIITFTFVSQMFPSLFERIC